ncbi:hypothetical protein C8F04DRAFT_1197006 [Mycena alexandri]|uniref:Uncharacterized protein n=1 Tax=Mycena alexandri TaxID=1745969 RepID=A0AAD6S4G6_9AGAR|nr:hypothetical protein C8F04DRAFT_1197006 [Mycena alexandri]
MRFNESTRRCHSARKVTSDRGVKGPPFAAANLVLIDCGPQEGDARAQRNDLVASKLNKPDWRKNKREGRWAAGCGRSGTSEEVASGKPQGKIVCCWGEVGKRGVKMNEVEGVGVEQHQTPDSDSESRFKNQIRTSSHANEIHRSSRRCDKDRGATRRICGITKWLVRPLGLFKVGS